jgi:hypothetical protein
VGVGVGGLPTSRQFSCPEQGRAGFGIRACRAVGMPQVERRASAHQPARLPSQTQPRHNASLPPAPQAVDFGCVLSDTLRRATLTLANRGKSAVAYSWTWLRQDAGAGGPPPGAPDAPEPGPAAPGAAAAGRAAVLAAPGPRPAASVAASSGPGPGGAAGGPLFDILPIHGRLAPGESEAAQVSFYAWPGVKASVQAVCRVAGGPEYQVRLDGARVCLSVSRARWQGVGSSFSHRGRLPHLSRPSRPVNARARPPPRPSARSCRCRARPAASASA